MTSTTRLDPRTVRLLICLAIAAGVLAVYGQVAGHGFINFDDPDYVTKNPHIQQGLTIDAIRWALTAGRSANWHPITWLSHMLDWELFGANPMGHHWTSVLIHLANSIILFLLLEKMTGAAAKSAFVAALFALHPLHVESVAWVSERKDVLCAFFWFLAMAAYLAYVRRPAPGRYAAVAVLFALALAAKPMAVTFPFLLLVLDYWPLKRLGWERFSWRIVWEKAPLVLLSAASSAVTLWAQHGGRTVASLAQFPFANRMGNALVAYAEYLIHTVWPVDLIVFYPYRTWAGWQVALAAVFLAAATLSVVALRRRFPYLLTGWLWYAGTLVPVIGLVQVGSQRMADRYTYVPLVGIFVVAAWAGAALLSRLSISARGRVAVGILAAVLLVPVSYRQVGYWKDSLTLFSHAVAAERQGAAAHFQLATALSENHRFDEAIFHYRKALAMNPGAVGVRANLAMTYLEAGRPKEALHLLKGAVARAPGDAGLQTNLATALLQTGDAAAAVSHYEKALALNADLIPALYNLARVYAVSPNPRLRNGKRGVVLAERLCDRTGRRQPVFLDILAAAYAEAGRFDRAADTAGRALQLANRQHFKKLAADLEKRLSKYRRHVPDRRPIP